MENRRRAPDVRGPPLGRPDGLRPRPCSRLGDQVAGAIARLRTWRRSATAPPLIAPRGSPGRPAGGRRPARGREARLRGHPPGRRLPLPRARGRAACSPSPARPPRPAGLARRGAGRGPPRAARRGARHRARRITRSCCRASRRSRPWSRATPCSGSRARGEPPAPRPSPQSARARPASPTACSAVLAEEPEAARRRDRGGGRQGGPHRLGGDRPRPSWPSSPGRLVPAALELSGCDAALVRSLDPAPTSTSRVRPGAVALRGARSRERRTPPAMLRPRRRRLPVAPDGRRDASHGCAGAARTLAGRPPWSTSAPCRRRSPRAARARRPCSPDAASRAPPVFGARARRRSALGGARSGPAVVVVNDMIVPTADPRLPFGGRGRSGYGVTRGAEGLLEMTTVKVIAVRRGRRHLHLEAPDPGTRTSSAPTSTLAHAGGLGPACAAPSASSARCAAAVRHAGVGRRRTLMSADRSDASA